MPKRRRYEQARDREEWEPGAARMEAMEGARLPPVPSRDANIAVLKPHVEEALRALSGLERQRGLSGRERMRAEALGMLLEHIEKTGERPLGEVWDATPGV